MRVSALLLFSLCALYVTRGFSQSKDSIPEFGQISKSDLLLSECDFDKDAEAMVLFDTEEVVCVEYTYSVSADIERHIRIKILKNKGLERANIKIPYFSGYGGEHVDVVAAQTYNIDASGNILIFRMAMGWTRCQGP